MISIVADENIPGLAAYFTDEVALTVLPGRSIDAAAVECADVLLVRSVTRVDPNLLKHSSVRFVATATSGTDHVDIDYLARRGIAFADAHGANAQAVTEYVLSIMALFAQGDLSANLWRSVGIVGMGQVGRRLNCLLSALGFKTRYYDPFLDKQAQLFAGVQSELEEVMSCDVVSIHAPLTSGGRFPTSRMIEDKLLALLPERAWLIHAARGGIIDEEALAAALGSRPELRCAVDVWLHEPAINASLAGLVDIATPHIAGYSKEAKSKATAIIIDALECHMASVKRDSVDSVFSAQGSFGQDAADSPEAYSFEGGLEKLLEEVFSFRKLDGELRRALVTNDRERLFDDLRKRVLGQRSELSSIRVALAPMAGKPSSSGRSALATERKREFDLRALDLLGTAFLE